MDVRIGTALICIAIGAGAAIAQSYLDGYRVRRDGSLVDPNYSGRSRDYNTNDMQGDPQRPDPSTRQPGWSDPYRLPDLRINPQDRDDVLGR